MKFPFITFCLLLACASTNGQQTQDWCGTQFTPQMETQLKQYIQAGDAAFRSRSSKEMVPMRVHILARDDGSDGYRRDRLWEAICQLNEDFDTTGFYFYIYEDINYIYNTDAFDGDWSSIETIVSANAMDNMLDVFFLGSVSGLCGCFRCFSNDEVTVVKGCANPGDHTLAHEVGHYFGLPHPFINSANGNDPEYVDGSNCGSAGDYMCDTRADYLDYRWSCPYTGDMTDPQGDTINPDETLIMSYSSDNCQSRFSPTQRNVMNNSLNNSRTYLLNYDDPDPVSMDVIPTLYAPDHMAELHQNCIELRWEAIPDAEFYHVTSVGQTLDTIVSDTSFYAQDLPVGQTINWKVKPIHRAYTCASFSSSRSFTVKAPVDFEVEFEVKDATTGNADGSINLQNVDGGEGPYSFNWSNGATDFSLTNIPAGAYTVTVTDAYNCPYVETFTVSEPTSLTNTEAPQTSLRTFPNPVSSSHLQVALEVPASQTGTIEIYDIHSRKVWQSNYTLDTGANNLEIPVHEWEGGVYLLRVQLADEVRTRKVLVVR